MTKIIYDAEFPLKYGDMCQRTYKSLAIAKREVTKAYKRFQAPDSFYATIHEYNRETKKKTLVWEVWI